MRFAAVLVLALVLPSLSFAQSVDCADGVIHDDGTFEDGYGSNSPFSAHIVMLMEPPELPMQLDSVCVCIFRLGTDSTLPADIVVWDSDGPDGGPGTRLGQVSGTATDVPTSAGTFYRFDLSSLELNIMRPFYTGPLWNSGDNETFFLCADEDGPTTKKGFFDAGLSAGVEPPASELGVGGLFAGYRTMGIRATFSEVETFALSDLSGLILPGFEIDTITPGGPTTFYGIRNATGTSRDLQIDYYGKLADNMPLRSEIVPLSEQSTTTANIGVNTTNLEIEDGIAKGLILFTEPETYDAKNFEGDYFRVDTTNAFASGDRLVRPEDFCSSQEVRFVDFGSGAELNILINRPRGLNNPSFTYTIYDEPGNLVSEGEYFSENHLVVADIAEFTQTESFGTMVFDFSASRGGWVSGRYSAFGQFSLELNSACRDGLD